MTQSEKIQSYIHERVDQYYNWYDKKAVKSKSKYQNTRIFSASSAVLIPFFTNINLTGAVLGKTINFGSLIVSILGITVALFIALEGVFHHREQWANSRSTAEYLQTQRVLFEHRAEDYQGLDEESAFTQLVNRVEKAIAEENAVTLNVLTRSEQAPEK